METQVFRCGGVVTYQLLCGREVARKNLAATQMANYVYLIVNTLDHTAIAVDAAWDVDGLYALADRLGVRIRGAIYTHSHFDHCGGKVPPMFTGGRQMPPLPGAREVRLRGGQLWAGAQDVQAIREQCAVDAVTELEDGSCIECGDLLLHVLRTPGHTPGSLCIFAAPQCLSPRGALRSALDRERVSSAEQGLLITGDTLFVGSCGRVDLPGSDQGEMLRSLSRLSTMHPEVLVLPGHNYASAPFSTIGAERDCNLMVQAGLRSVPSPPPLPPCCQGDAHGGCGPRGFVVGRKLRVIGRRRVSGGEADDAERFGVLHRFVEQSGTYALRLLPDGDVVQVTPDRLAAVSQKPSL